MNIVQFKDWVAKSKEYDDKREFVRMKAFSTERPKKNKSELYVGLALSGGIFSLLYLMSSSSLLFFISFVLIGIFTYCFIKEIVLCLLNVFRKTRLYFFDKRYQKHYSLFDTFDQENANLYKTILENLNMFQAEELRYVEKALELLKESKKQARNLQLQKALKKQEEDRLKEEAAREERKREEEKQRKKELLEKERQNRILKIQKNHGFTE